MSQSGRISMNFSQFEAKNEKRKENRFHGVNGRRVETRFARNESSTNLEQHFVIANDYAFLRS